MNKKPSSLALYVWIGAILVFCTILGFVLGHFDQPINIAVVLAVSLIVFVLPFLLKDPEFGLALVGFFLPFERVPSIDLGGITLKVNHILIIVVLISFLASKAIRRDLKIPKDPIRYFVILFIFALTLSVTQAINLGRSYEVLSFIILMGIVYFTVTLVAQSEKAIKYAVKGILWGAVAAGFLGIYQFLGDMVGLPISLTLLKEGYDKTTFGFARIQAASMEPLYFANYIFIPLLVTFMLFLRGQATKFFGRVWSIILILVLLIDFVLAISRGAYIALALVFILILAAQAKLVFRIKTVVITASIILIVAAGAYLALVKSESDALDQFIGHALVNDISNGESVSSRITATGEALGLFVDHPVLGVGLGNYGPVVQNDPPQTPAEGWFIVNNEYAEILAENGLVGAIAFLMLIIVIFWCSILAFVRAKDQFMKSLILGLIFAFIAILIQYVTFSTIYIIHIWFLIGLIAAVSAFILNKNDTKNL